MMVTTLSIDKAGRIVVPKSVRDELHLTPGTVLRLELSGERLILAPAVREAHLTIENGTPLVVPADPSGTPILTTEMVNEIIARGRLERSRRLQESLKSDEEPR